MKAKYKNIKFNTEKSLNEFLSCFVKYIVHLEDKHQDLLTFWVHSSGEILNSNAHSSIYIGRFIDVTVMEVDMPLRISNTDEFDESDEEQWSKLIYFPTAIDSNIPMDTLDLVEISIMMKRLFSAVTKGTLSKWSSKDYLAFLTELLIKSRMEQFRKQSINIHPD